MLLPKANKRGGFTLIELLIVIAIIAIIAAVVFVALDPLTRFRDARDSARWSDISGLASAIRVHQVDNGGAFLTAITNATTSEVMMIGTDVTTTADDYDAFCDTDVVSSTNWVDLTGLVTAGYIGEVPISPNGDGTWTAGHTGFTMEKSAVGTITIRACESENSSEIKIVR